MNYPIRSMHNVESFYIIENELVPVARYWTADSQRNVQDVTRSMLLQTKGV